MEASDSSLKRNEATHETSSSSSAPPKTRSKMRSSTWFVILFMSVCVTQLPISPYGMLETVSRYYRQGSRYQENHNVDTTEEVLHSTKYDFIVIGGGTAGSVIANRLTENPKWNVLLLEAGQDEFMLMDVPILSGHWQLTDYNWGYSSVPQANACLAMKDRRCKFPRGKSLGGSSSINYMIYTRGNSKDYDEWASLGNYGWDFKSILPYFMKSENMQIPELVDSKWHSQNGYLNIGYSPFRTPLADAFMDAGEEMGYPHVDYNGEHQLGFSYIQATIRNGTRCSASKAFLRSVGDRTNLHISLQSRASRIIVDKQTRKAVGVEFTKNGKKLKIKVRKEVILSAGAINSPQILMLSGIGPKDHLTEMGIPVLQNLPVGENLQEHVAFLGLTVLVNETVAVVESRLNAASSLAQSVPQFLFKGNGPLTVLGSCEALAFVRTEEAEDTRPDVELLFVAGSLMSDGGKITKKSLGLTDEFYDSVYKTINQKDAWSIWPMVMRPKSRGHIRLKSKNTLDSPNIDPNFFEDQQDMKTLLAGLKMSIKIVNTTAFQRFGSKVHDVPIPGCSGHDFGTDSYWECAIRHLTGNVHHQCGTCKMGNSSDPTAVVDPELRVYGIQGLRVADASIIPLMPTAHTNAPVFMIGERAADLIKKTWASGSSS